MDGSCINAKVLNSHSKCFDGWSELATYKKIHTSQLGQAAIFVYVSKGKSLEVEVDQVLLVMATAQLKKRKRAAAHHLLEKSGEELGGGVGVGGGLGEELGGGVGRGGRSWGEESGWGVGEEESGKSQRR